MTESYHIPIMAERIIALLDANKGGIFVDGTFGGGGHSEKILEMLPEGSKLISIDRDADAIVNAQRLKDRYGDKLVLVRDNYENIESILDSCGITKINGILLDLGVSSHQIDTASRGFSYRMCGRLDMRMDTRQNFSAYDIVNGYSEEKLIKIFFEYGEEKFSKKIAWRIVQERQKAPIETTERLAEICRSAVPPFGKGGHPAKRVFQAIRIEVNAELTGLERAINGAVDRLESGGKIAILTFHSLEDRIVKNVFRLRATDCICDKSMPICICGHKADLKLIDKGTLSSEQELKDNKRAESAKLRSAQKI